MNAEIKLSFVHKCVRQYVEDVVEAMDKSVRKNKAIDTGALRDSLASVANENVGKLMFKEYGRFIDMGVGRGKSLASVRAETSTMNGKQRKLRKRKKIYSPIAYGKLNGLMADLMYGLTETTIATIKNELQSHTLTTVN